MTQEELENLKEGDILTYVDGKECEFIYLHNDNRSFLVRYGTSDYMDYCSSLLAPWSIKPKERETITLTEYICDFGRILFLTTNKEFISFHESENNKIVDFGFYRDKCVKAPNARTVKVYADTLEYVQ